MSNLWKKWITISKKLVIIPANIILTVLYIIFIIPLSLILKSFFKQTLMGHGYQRRDQSYWVKRRKIKYTIEWAKEQ